MSGSQYNFPNCTSCIRAVGEMVCQVNQDFSIYLVSAQCDLASKLIQEVLAFLIFSNILGKEVRNISSNKTYICAIDFRSLFK